ncbi:predicted protein [Naegleria gruberi]|uniref:Predicted protein n=1 Tax=Naegleria gruberi TaxID=5762 RepID=D2VVG3_NAEGR|nr:uncharacterized protein NAEGRDRAFT_73009 [Naegleria gruberi]EFC39303.1 predicted protein [Naegleria gruberi]|eukprot:XP_002672047.1 predicted protein [Naegleria gruberi strain NEG-M]
MGLYAEFTLFNLKHLADRIRKIQQASSQSEDQTNDKKLEQVLEQIFSDQEEEQDQINKRIKKKYIPYDASKRKYKALDFIEEGKITDWKHLLDNLKPCFHVATLNFNAFDLFVEFANELDLDECWSNEEEFEGLICGHTIFKSDMQEELNSKYLKKDSNGKYEDLNSEGIERMKKLFREEPYFSLLSVATQHNSRMDGDVSITFIHPNRLRELSEHFQHSTQIPRSILVKNYQNAYDEYLNTPEKKKSKQEEKKAKMTIEEFISSKMDIDTFDDMLQYYNNPKFVFSLIDRPVMDKGPIQRIWNEELHTDYWISIMEIIGDPFTLARLGMTCTKLYELFQKKKDQLFNSEYLKKDIGFFVYFG